MTFRSVNFRRSGGGATGSVSAKLFEINWLLPTLVGVVGLVGVVMIYAATDGVWQRGAFQHITRIGFGGVIMLAVAMVDIRIWYRLAYPAYVIGLVLLLGVEPVSYTHLTLPTTPYV